MPFGNFCWRHKRMLQVCHELLWNRKRKRCGRRVRVIPVPLMSGTVVLVWTKCNFAVAAVEMDVVVVVGVADEVVVEGTTTEVVIGLVTLVGVIEAEDLQVVPHLAAVSPHVLHRVVVQDP